MKSSVVITLIIVGGAVVVAPIVASYLLRASHQEHVADLLMQGATSVNLLKEDLGEWETFGCWFTGTAMALAGMVLAFRGAGDGNSPPNSSSPSGG